MTLGCLAPYRKLGIGNQFISMLLKYVVKTFVRFTKFIPAF
jgi:hypothetical protein